MKLRLVHQGIVFVPLYKEDIELEIAMKKHGYEYRRVDDV